LIVSALLISLCVTTLIDARSTHAGDLSERDTSEFGVRTASIVPRARRLTGTKCTVHRVKKAATNGVILTRPAVRLLFWKAAFWNAEENTQERDYYVRGVTALANNPAFWTSVNEYGVKGGSWAGSTVLTLPSPTSTATEVSDATVEQTLTAYFDANSSIANSKTIFVVMLPEGVKSISDVDNHDVGHHHYFQYNRKPLYFAVIEYDPQSMEENRLATVTHEIFEAATDPQGTGYKDKTTGKEIADLCEGPPEMHIRSLAGYEVERVWSQTACACV